MPTVSVNGTSLNYEAVGEGPPLVYLAGTRFDSALAWVPYMSEYARGFRVILPDPRGMAGSARVSQIDPSDWVADLDTLLDCLGIAVAYIAAETLGSRIATRLAADYPARVSRLILNAPIAYSSPLGDEQRRQSADPANMPAARRRDMERHHGADWPAVNTFYQELHARPDFHQYYDLRPVAARVTAPTLVLRGDIDEPVHPIAHAVELHGLLPTSWLAIFPNTEFNVLRAHPTPAWALIHEFIAATGKGAPA